MFTFVSDLDSNKHQVCFTNFWTSVLQPCWNAVEKLPEFSSGREIPVPVTLVELKIFDSKFECYIKLCTLFQEFVGSAFQTTPNGTCCLDVAPSTKEGHVQTQPIDETNKTTKKVKIYSEQI